MCAKASHSASESACTQAGKKKLDQAKWREATESRFAEMKSDMDGQRDVDGDARKKRKRGEGLRDTVASTSGLSGSGRMPLPSLLCHVGGYKLLWSSMYRPVSRRKSKDSSGGRREADDGAEVVPRHDETTAATVAAA